MSNISLSRSNPSADSPGITSTHDLQTDTDILPNIHPGENMQRSRNSSTSPYSAPVVEQDDSHSARRHGNSSSGTNKSRKWSQSRRLFCWNWFFEITSVLLSILGFQAAIGVMIWADNKPLTSWKFTYSINTVVSVLTIVSRATLGFAISACLGQQKWNSLNTKSQRLATFEHFDAASRGPLGGLKLLIDLRWRHFAALGGFATVFFLAFDPFLQSMINFESRPSGALSSSSSLNKIVRLDLGQIAFGDGWKYTVASSTNMTWAVRQQLWSNSNPDSGLSVAATLGFSNSTLSKTLLSPSCTTGNCTWPLYNSLGICSSCSDISSHIVRKRRLNLNNENIRYQFDDLDGYNNFRDCVGPYTYADVNCYHLSSDGLSATDSNNDTISTGLANSTLVYNMTYQLPSVGFTNQEQAFLNPNTDIIIVANATSEPQETINSRNQTTLLAAFTIIKSPDSYLENKTTWNETTPIAQECVLHFCANEYSVEVVNGNITQNVRPAQFKRNPASYGNSTNSTFINETIWLTYGGLPIGDFTRLYNVTVAENTLKSWFNNTALWRHDGSIINMPGPPGDYDLQLISESHNGSQETFNISINATISTIQYMLSWTVGQTSVQISDFTSEPDYEPNDFVTSMVNNSGNSFIDMLSSSTDIPTTFDNVARQMSNYIQTLDKNGQSEPVYGTSVLWETHIKITWPYITVPALTLIVGYIFVFLALWETRRVGLRPWKESTIPILSHGLCEEDQLLLQEAESDDRIEVIERTTRARLIEEQGGMVRLNLRH